MIAWAKRLKWYWWLVLLLPGGAIILALKARSSATPVAGTDYGDTTASVAAGNRAAEVTAVTENLVADAKVQADTLTKELQGNPLAATLLGISPTLIPPAPTPPKTKVA